MWYEIYFMCGRIIIFTLLFFELFYLQVNAKFCEIVEIQKPSYVT